MDDWYERVEEPDGAIRYRLCGVFPDCAPPDTDLAALVDGYVSITPLHFNMTHEGELNAIDKWQWPELY